MTNKTTELPLVVPITIRPDDNTLLTYAKNVFYVRDNYGKLKMYKRPALRHKPINSSGGYVTDLLHHYKNAIQQGRSTFTPQHAGYLCFGDTSGGAYVSQVTYDITNDEFYDNRSSVTFGLGAISDQFTIEYVYSDSSNDAIYTVTEIDNSSAIYNTFKTQNGGIGPVAGPSSASIANGWGGTVGIDNYVVHAIDDYVIHCDYQDITTWTATNINVPRRSPYVISVNQHENDVVVFSDRTVEFLYNNNNPPNQGSTFNAREDIIYNVGIASMPLSRKQHNRYVDGDIDLLAFVGRSTSGRIGIYILENHQLKHVSSDIDQVFVDITDTKDSSHIHTELHWINLLGTPHLLVNKYYVTTSGSGDADHQVFVYNPVENIWTVWEFDSNIITYPYSSATQRRLAGVLQFPVSDTGTSKMRTTVQAVETWSDLGVSGVHGWLHLVDFASFQDTDKNDTARDIDVELVYPSFIGEGTDDPTARKYGNFLKVVADEQASAQTVNVSWSDDDYVTYSTARTMTLGYDQQLPQLGSWRRRSFKFAITDNQAIGISSIYLNYQIGDE
jgi:hypothetical protein